MTKSNTSKKLFGPYIRSLRLKLNIGQRELAEKIAVPYFLDISLIIFSPNEVLPEPDKLVIQKRMPLFFFVLFIMQFSIL